MQSYNRDGLKKTQFQKKRDSKYAVFEQEWSQEKVIEEKKRM